MPDATHSWRATRVRTLTVPLIGTIVPSMSVATIAGTNCAQSFLNALLGR